MLDYRPCASTPTKCSTSRRRTGMSICLRATGRCRTPWRRTGGAEATALSVFGRRWGSAPMFEQARLANANPPSLRTFDARDTARISSSSTRPITPSWPKASARAFTPRPGGRMRLRLPHLPRLRARRGRGAESVAASTGRRNLCAHAAGHAPGRDLRRGGDRRAADGGTPQPCAAGGLNRATPRPRSRHPEFSQTGAAGLSGWQGLRTIASRSDVEVRASLRHALERAEARRNGVAI